MTHPIARVRGFKYDTLSKELEIPTDSKDVFVKLLRAFQDDFWQDGHGSLLPPASGAHSSSITTKLEKRFVYRNVVRECVERVSRAFFGKNPNWKIEPGAGGETPDPAPDPSPTDPPPDTVEEQDPVEKALGALWTEQNFGTVLARAFESRLATGRGGVRMYIPLKYKRKAQEAGNGATAPNIGTDDEAQQDLEAVKDYVVFESVEAALEAIRIEFIDPKDSKVLDEGGDLFSMVRYSVREDWEDKQDVAVIEFSFVDDSDLTWIGLVKDKGDGGAQGEAPDNPGSVTADDDGFSVRKFIKSSGYDLAGQTTFYEMWGERYVTEALYRNNQLLNLALTCAGFSLVDNGFGEVFLTNVELETETVPGPDGGTVEQPKRLVRGGGAVQNLIGIEDEVDAETGAVRRATPGVTFKDPSPLDAFTSGKQMAYTACLEEAGQLYALISGDATASGESRIQAMKDFYLKIVKYKSEVDQLGGWALTTALLWAVALAQDSKFEGARVTYDSKIFIGDVSKEERAALIEQWKAGVISKETCQVLSGVDDPALEDERTMAEQQQSIEEVSLGEVDRRSDIAVKLDGQIPKDRIRRIVFGYDEAEIAALNAEDEAAAEEQLRKFEEEQRRLNPEPDPDDVDPDDPAAAEFGGE
jgi:hypothetical protein